ncbi:MAG: DUF4197 domain-containing protein [Bacteroidetes bacterium]|nr:DUF4197 domain-containing protein [Bacteroidota bacterium]
MFKKILIAALILNYTNIIKAQSLLDKLKREKDSLEKVAKEKANAILNGNQTPKLTNEEVIKGLREALTVGTNSSTSIAGKADGFYKNARLFIPWPQEAQNMKERLVKMGLKNKVNEFETSLNRAAEEAATKAAPVFIDAITKMSVQDGFAILKGADTSATNYLRKNTYAQLNAQFLPVVKQAIEKVKVTSYWNPLVTTYNKLPGVKKQNPDLNAYVTNKAINGLMILIADEEQNIRKNPAARVSDILKKVFGAN